VRNKETDIKPTSFLPPFPGSTLLLHSRLFPSPRVAWQGFSLLLLTCHTFPLLQLGSFPGCGAGYFLQYCGPLPPPPALTLVFTLMFLTLFVPSSSLCHFLPFLKHAFAKVLPAWLMGSAGSCCGSIVELTGTSCVQHGGNPSLCSHRPILYPHAPTSYYQNLAIYTRYTTRTSL